VSDPVTAGEQGGAPGRRRRRTGPGPLIVLLLVALLPAIGLFVLFNWSDGRDDENEVAPPPPTTIVAPPPPAAALTNGFYSLRRMPTIISRDESISEFEEQLLPFLGSINDRSCVAVSVDGIGVGAANDKLAVIPASNQKLLVAAVALDVLGEEYRYETEVAVAADPVDGVVAGDLYLVGGGDPLLSSAWYPTSNMERNPVTSPTSLDALADSVRDAGITIVRGSVIGDGSRYDDEFFAPGWGNGVAGLEAGPYDALMANDSRVLNDELKANDPNEGAAREFTRLLQDRGITVEGVPGTGTAPGARTTIGAVSSAPMSAIVGEMVGNSDNNTAELMVKELGFAVSAEGTRPAGLQVIRNTLDDWGLDTSNVVLGDGSGLSLDNRLDCRIVLDVLQREPVEGPIGAGLPVAGETGTLSDIFVDHEVAGRLRGKTGTLNNPPFNADPPAVKALSGYLPIDGGGAIEYSLILNGPTISDQSEYRPIWEAFADVLATYPSGPTPAEIGLLP
jgi:D-alanyl-D-alanine carboxypeptidase/D-alanyl-D-alanine-endopeptidase (penicillin-binding protein 4)